MSSHREVVPTRLKGTYVRRRVANQIMSNSAVNLTKTPEQRVLRSMYRTKKAGLTPSGNPSEYGTVIEELVLNELQAIAARLTQDRDLRFARGYVTEDYGSEKYVGASAKNAADSTLTDSPRFDIICYEGDVAWTTHGDLPHALVPASFVKGVIEVKRTLAPSSFEAGKQKDINPQLRQQKDHLERVGCPDCPIILLGTHFWATSEDQVRELADAEHVFLVGDIRSKKVKAGVEAMAEDHVFEQRVSLLL